MGMDNMGIIWGWGMGNRIGIGEANMRMGWGRCI
jgi:hypothetical protein